MRLFIMPLLSLMACSVSGGTQAAAGAVALTCPKASAPATVLLCDALAAELRQQGYDLDQTGAAPLRLILDADSPRPSVLNARLIVERDGTRAAGEDMQLMVVDRDAIPGKQIEKFAKILLLRAALPGPQE